MLISRRMSPIEAEEELSPSAAASSVGTGGGAGAAGAGVGGSCSSPSCEPRILNEVVAEGRLSPATGPASVASFSSGASPSAGAALIPDPEAIFWARAALALVPTACMAVFGMSASTSTCTGKMFVPWGHGMEEEKIGSQEIRSQEEGQGVTIVFTFALTSVIATLSSAPRRFCCGSLTPAIKTPASLKISLKAEPTA